MSEKKPRTLRDVRLVWWGPDVNGLGEILSVRTVPGGSLRSEPPGAHQERGVEQQADEGRQHGNRPVVGWWRWRSARSQSSVR
jgi:hypothetical protein